MAPVLFEGGIGSKPTPETGKPTGSGLWAGGETAFSWFHSEFLVGTIHELSLPGGAGLDPAWLVWLCFKGSGL